MEWLGNEKAASSIFDALCPGGKVVLVGAPGKPIEFNVSMALLKEARVEGIFRYAHVYPRAIALIGSGQLDVKPLITDNFGFADSVKAFEYALHMPANSVKVQIMMPQ